MIYAITMRPETTLDLTTYWLVVDGDNVGTIAPFRGAQLAPVSVADHWVWRINFPMMDMPDWCKGHAPSLEQAQVEAEHAFTRIRDSLSEDEYDEALWKKGRQGQEPQLDARLSKDTSVSGTFETCRRTLRTSVCECKTEVADRLPKWCF